MEETQYDYWYWRDVRLDILSRDKVCGYCRKELDERTVTIDHLIPVSRGGEIHDKSNMVASCKDCNAEKSDMMPLEFIDSRRVNPCNSDIYLHAKNDL